MTDEMPKPKRKRWRWIIAGVLLFVVAVAGWWGWPRGDERLVGHWRQVKSGEAPKAMTLKANGSAIVDYGKARIRCSWKFDGKTLTFGRYLPSPLRNVPAAINKVYGTQVFLEQPFSLKRVQFLGPDAISVVDSMGWGMPTYHRVGD